MPRRVREGVGLCVYAQCQDAFEDLFREGKEGRHREGGGRGRGAWGVGRCALGEGGTVVIYTLEGGGQTLRMWHIVRERIYVTLETSFKLVSGPSTGIRYRYRGYIVPGMVTGD